MLLLPGSAGFVAIFKFQEVPVGKEGAHRQGVFVGLGNTPVGGIVITVHLVFIPQAQGQLIERPEFQFALEAGCTASVGQTLKQIQVTPADGEVTVKFVAGLKIQPSFRLRLGGVVVEINQGLSGFRIVSLKRSCSEKALL